MEMSFIQPRLVGNTVSLFPLEPSHFDELYLAASDPLIWAGHPRRDRYKKDAFSKLFDDSINSKGSLVVVDNVTGKLIGSSRYYELDESKSEICVGYSFLIRDYWGGATNKEVKDLLVAHAFKRVQTVWFHVDVSNNRSQKAMIKIGAVESHIAEKTFNGNTATYVFFKIERANG